MQDFERKKYEKRYIEKFEQLDVEALKLKPGEQIVHCIDDVSFGGQFYAPEWAITNMGRGYSLSQSKWLTPQAVGTNRDYWAFCGRKHPKVHQLVLNYFPDESDKIALQLLGEDGVEGHHIIAINIPEDLKKQTAANAQARIEHCMACNKKSNVVYQEKKCDHTEDHYISNGKKTPAEQRGSVIWSKDLQVFRSVFMRSDMLSGNSSGAYYVYSENPDGTLKRSVKMICNLKGASA